MHFSELIFLDEYQISYQMIDLRFCRAPDAIHKYSKYQMHALHVQTLL